MWACSKCVKACSCEHVFVCVSRHVPMYSDLNVASLLLPWALNIFAFPFLLCLLSFRDLGYGWVPVVEDWMGTCYLLGNSFSWAHIGDMQPPSLLLVCVCVCGAGDLTLPLLEDTGLPNTCTPSPWSPLSPCFYPFAGGSPPPTPNPSSQGFWPPRVPDLGP